MGEQEERRDEERVRGDAVGLGPLGPLLQPAAARALLLAATACAPDNNVF